MATLFYNLLGYLPAPFVFGVVADCYPENGKYSMQLAMGVILYWSILALIFMILAYIVSLKTRLETKKPALQITDSQFNSVGAPDSVRSGN